MQPKPKPRPWRCIASLRRAIEAGPPLRWLLAALRDRGIAARAVRSRYLGHIDLEVRGSARAARRALRREGYRPAYLGGGGYE